METPEQSFSSLEHPDGSFSEFEEFMKEHKLDTVRDAFFDRLGTVSVALLGLLAAFAWDEVAKEFFIIVFPHASSLGLHALYAIVLTLLVVIASLQIPHVKHYMQFRKAMKEMGKKLKQ